jgi:predicted ATPase
MASSSSAKTAETRPPYAVFIEGNVGSGKTTFLEHFASCPNVFLAKEPVHIWQNVNGHNFLVSPALTPYPVIGRTSS